MATIGNEIGHKWIQSLRNFSRGFMHVNTLVCGIPLPAGHGSFRLRNNANRPAITSELSGLLRRIAWSRWFQAIVIKDVDERGMSQQEVETHGFLTIDAPPMNVIRTQHDCLENWLQSLRSHYRYAWQKSLKKFDQSEMRCRRFVGKEILDHYDRRTHRLYTNLVARQNLCLERMPHRFFKHLVEACGDRVHMTAIYSGKSCVAFCWSLQHNDVYQNLLCGFDRRRNRECDLYFNLAIRDMGYGLQLGAKEVWLGQTTDEFKARLGADTSPRQMHIRCIPPVTAGLRLFRKFIFPQNADFRMRRVHRSPSPVPLGQPSPLDRPSNLVFG